MLYSVEDNNVSVEQKGYFFKGISESIKEFEEKNEAFAVSGCPKCSGNGVCTKEDPLYLMPKCECHEGWVGLMCNLDEEENGELEQINLELLDAISKAQLRLTTGGSNMEYLNAVLTLVSSPMNTDRETASALSIISNVIHEDYMRKDSDDTFDRAKMTVAAQVIDICLQYIYNTDCMIEADLSRQLYNQSLEARSPSAMAERSRPG